MFNATLNQISIKKKKISLVISCSSAPKEGGHVQKEPTPEEKVWEILIDADKKDYERICAENGITNFRGMLKKLKQMKQEQGDDIAEVHAGSEKYC